MPFFKNLDYPEDAQHQSVLVYKIKWLMLFRVVLVTILLGSALILQIKLQKTRPLELLYLLIIVSYVFTVVTVNFLQRVSNLRLYAYLQIVYDLFLETGIVYITGGIESIFTFTLHLYYYFRKYSVIPTRRIYRRIIEHDFIWDLNRPAILPGPALIRFLPLSFYDRH